MRRGNLQQFRQIALGQAGTVQPLNQLPLALSGVPHRKDLSAWETHCQAIMLSFFAVPLSCCVLKIFTVKLKADVLLRENVRALLRARHQTAEALAFYCGHRAAWISKILSGERNAKVAELGKIAGFFGIQVSDLFTPGASSLTERRRGGDRRSGLDRRSGNERRACLRDLRKRMPKMVAVPVGPVDNGADDLPR